MAALIAIRQHRFSICWQQATPAITSFLPQEDTVSYHACVNAIKRATLGTLSIYATPSDHRGDVRSDSGDTLTRKVRSNALRLRGCGARSPTQLILFLLFMPAQAVQKQLCLAHNQHLIFHKGFSL